MTGYGRGLAEREGLRAVVEIRSVNHRYLDLKLRGSSLEPAVEDKVQALVRGRATRGSVTVVVRVDGARVSPGVRVDLDIAEQVHSELQRLAAAFSLSDEVTLSVLCDQPGVLVPLEADRGSALLVEAVEEAVRHALDQLIEMRAAEGARLGADMGARLERLRELAGSISELAQSAPEQAQTRIRERLSKLLEQHAGRVDDERLAQEVAMLADRLDVTEELVRTRSHIDQLDELMAEKKPVGRRLDFLLQELGREFNTVSSKSQSAEIARAVVEAKAELEKLREQSQNIE